MKQNLLSSICIILCTVLISSGPVFAENIIINEEPLLQKEIKKSFSNYEAAIFYNSLISPGDPFFVRLALTPANKTGKKLLKKKPVVSASYWSNANPDKALRKTELYAVPQNKKNSVFAYFIGALPSSTYLEPAIYKTTVTWNFENGDSETQEYYVTVVPKDFVNETIPLDARNTAIRTDDSELRKIQIEKLNKVLGTKNPESVYETEGFIYPTNATRRTSFFADRRIFAYNDGTSATSLHYGIDWGVPTGTNVAACGKGKVVMAENRITTGWSVCIEHLPGLYSLYYHMSKLDVSEGQIVEKGQSLGQSGATGLATGPHIHWEVRLNMEAINPEYFTISGMW